MASRVAFSDDTRLEEMKDLDDLTDSMLLREKSTWSKAKLKRLRVMSVITGNYASRKKIFSEIQEHADFKIYEISLLGKTIPCAKVFNPAILEKNSKIWPKLSQVQRFELEDPEGILTVVPKHYATNMERLESFSITWTRVKSLPNELFREGLKTLSLPRNQLKTLNGIEKAVDLSNLDVSSNMLTELPKTFGHLHKLTTLNISGNAIRELPGNFGSMSQLRMLDCSCNRLLSLPDSIENLLELTSLDVCNNQLVALPETIGNMPKLEDLRARGNQLQYLPLRFERLFRLSSLILRKNKFEEVPPQLSNISSLQSLNMRDNSIRSFPRAIPSLKTLILDSNQLTEISDGIMECVNLQMVSLERNRIASIPRGILKLRSLRVLHLSGNDIEEVPEFISCLEHLRHLGLRSTGIHRLPTAIVYMENLVQLDIDDCQELEDKYLIKELRDNGIAGLKAYLKENSADGFTAEVRLRNVEVINKAPGSVFPHSGPFAQLQPLTSANDVTLIDLTSKSVIAQPQSSSPGALVQQNTRVSQMPPSWQAANQSEQQQQQQVQLVQANRGTMLSPPSRTYLQLGSIQQLAGQQVLAQRNTMRSERSEYMNLSTICESQAEDQEDVVKLNSAVSSFIETKCLYGVGKKTKISGNAECHGGEEEGGGGAEIRGGGRREGHQLKMDKGDPDTFDVVDSGVLIRERLIAKQGDVVSIKNARQSQA